jgi:hypothetical protein
MGRTLAERLRLQLTQPTIREQGMQDDGPERTGQNPQANMGQN